MMKDTLEFLKARSQKDPGFTFEILIVDDGSQDLTVRVALEIAQLEANKDIRVLSFEKNRGKGGAVIQVNWQDVNVQLKANNPSEKNG